MGALLLSAVDVMTVNADGGNVPPPASGGSTRKAPSSSNTLSNGPSGTKVVVLDQQGNKVPLGSQEAASIIASGDPIWCPIGQKPGGSGCTAAESTVAALITDLGSKSGAGTVYFTSTYSTNDITFNGSVLTGLTDLTLQGGWNGLSGVNFSLSGVTNFGSNPLTIENWNGNVTVIDITISSTSGDGLTVATTGNIHLAKVTSSGSTTGQGASLNNKGGTGSISVDHSTFNGNARNGLFALSKGDISLSSVMANDNSEDGAYLDNSSGTGSLNVDNSTFNGSTGAHGIEAYSGGSITLLKIAAAGNAVDGANLSNNSGDGSISVDASAFENNDSAGLFALSNGDFMLNSVIANSNKSSEGAYLNNSSGTGNILLTGANNQFNGNGLDGLEATSNGNITLNHLTADNNTSYGAVLENAGSLSISQGTFNSNTEGNGLYAIAGSDINLNNVVANGNSSSDGAYLDNSAGNGGISVEGLNQFSNNGDNGLNAHSTGAIALNGVTADANGFSGTFLFTSSNIEVDHSSFDGNGYNGLYADPPPSGTVTISCSDSSNNHVYGIEYDGGGALTLNTVTLLGNSVSNSPLLGGGGLLVNNTAFNCNPTTHTSGTPLTRGSLPTNMIDVTGNAPETLNCTQYSGTELVLPDQDYVLLPCPIGQTGAITSKTTSSLPSNLDAKYTFVSGFDVEVNPSLTGSMIVSFKIPAGEKNKNFTILHWDGSKWIDLGGVGTSDGFFQANTALTGVFVLLTQ